jgi:hypothetical protein
MLGVESGAFAIRRQRRAEATSTDRETTSFPCFPRITLMCDFLPADEESLRQWCRHQINHVPRMGPGLGMRAPEIAVFVDDCRILIDALEGSRRRGGINAEAKAARKHLVRIKKTSLRRQIEQTKAKTGYGEDKAVELRWVEVDGRDDGRVAASKGVAMAGR